MKIKYDSVSTENVEQSKEEKQLIQDLTNLMHELEVKYGKVNIYNIDGEIFFFRALKRGEYLKLCKEERISELDKEDIVCNTCIVYPEHYDFENCDAAVPSLLCKAILKASYLDSIETRTGLMNYFREEMFDFQNQITCIINEAFPQFSLEEIEDWDMEKTAMYLSRSEWKLVNFRGANFNFDPNEMEQPEQQVQEVPQVQNEPKQKQERTTNFKGGAKEKLTPEKLRELQTKFPDIDWAADAVLREGIKGIDGAETVDTVSPALRPGF